MTENEQELLCRKMLVDFWEDVVINGLAYASEQLYIKINDDITVLEVLNKADAT